MEDLKNLIDEMFVFLEEEKLLLLSTPCNSNISASNSDFTTRLLWLIQQHFHLRFEFQMCFQVEESGIAISSITTSHCKHISRLSSDKS